jgi:MFS family permease
LWHGPEIALGSMTLPLVVLLVPVGAFFFGFMQAPPVTSVQNLAAPHIRTQATAAFFFVTSTLGMGLGPISIGFFNDLVTPFAGEEAVRYSLLASLSFLLLGALLYWRASHHYAVAYLRK